MERIIAGEIAENENLIGLGPKQSRNFLQYLGLTQYEIPIDSRIFKWLNANHIFPFKVTSKALSDENYYRFLNDAIISLCDKARVKPCLFDAAVFSSYEKVKNKN